jgi:uncharacterized membrane protein YhaH (DUF805 family)
MTSVTDMLFSAEGRIRRRDYWLWSILVNLAALAAQYYVFGQWGSRTSFLDALFFSDPWQPDEVTLLYFLVFGLTLWPIVCLNAKRWHDRGKPGWLAGLVMALGLGCYALRWLRPGYDVDDEVYRDLVFGLPAIYGVMLLWTFVECGLLDGQPESNRYGPPPKAYATASEWI